MARRALPSLILALVAFAFTAGCGEDPARIIMTNRTGEELKNVTLDYGSGSKTYQIFGKDYTFGVDVDVQGTQSLSLKYDTAQGESVDVPISETLEPDMNGRNVILHFKPDGRYLFTTSGK